MQCGQLDLIFEQWEDSEDSQHFKPRNFMVVQCHQLIAELNKTKHSLTVLSFIKPVATQVNHLTKRHTATLTHWETRGQNQWHCLSFFLLFGL